ncbi:uncharacterized protein LOC114952686 isoform X3 [Acropora millepora]|uniref:uncharacterized protein LOC114952686 isoform X3 n=1 Tax=Acropora millepora TaxID=45264 RepID=UPI001CF15ED2|nr:uncharacterized protein LOC114952686 isoform X3 [Acropora millepora]
MLFARNAFVCRDMIQQLKSGETCLSSENSSEDDKDLPLAKDNLKSSQIPACNMSNYYFSHIHQNDGTKSRGKPSLSGHKAKSNGDKRGRGIAKPAGRTSARDRDQYPDTVDVNQRRAVSQHCQQHGSGDVSRNSGRYGSPVRRVVEDPEGRNSSSAKESRKFQPMEENKPSKVTSHRRDAPREKQRLTQDLARQKRLLSEDIARAELLQRGQLSKKLSDMFEGKKESLGADKAAGDISEENESKDNDHQVESCRALEKDESPSMYDKCYGNYSPEYLNEQANNSSTHDENSDGDCKGTESLSDPTLRKESVPEIKNIEFVNESKVEVKEMVLKESLPVKTCVDSEICETVSEPDTRPRGLEPLKFENVTDDELAFSDSERDAAVIGNSDISPNEFALNGGSPAFLKALSPVENELESNLQMNCNSVEELKDSSPKSDVFSEENVIPNLECETCECPSEDVEGKSSEGNERSLEPDHSNVKNSKVARLMEEPDMQCEHSSKCSLESQEDQVFTEENDVEKADVLSSVDLNEKQSLEMQIGSRETLVVERKTVGMRADMKEIHSSDVSHTELSRRTSCDVEPNAENATNESELSNIEGMSDAGELSETEAGLFVNRGKIKKKKRRKPKGLKSVQQSAFGNPRRKAKGHKGRSAVKDSKTVKRIKQLDSESDDEAVRQTSQEWAENVEFPSQSHSAGGKQSESSKPIAMEINDHCGTNGEQRLHSPSQECNPEDCREEVVAMGTVTSDHCESSQETGERNTELGKSTERKIARTKRKSEEKDRDRSTPPDLISQNRYARDLPRHNWLVERLRQQNKLCSEDTQQHPRDSKDEDDNEENPAGDVQEGSRSSDKEAPAESRHSPKLTPENSERIGSTSPKRRSENEEPRSPEVDDFENELHRSFLRSLPPNVPRALPRLKPSVTESSSANENKPLPPPLKHGLSSKETCSLEPIPKLRKISDEKESTNETTQAQEETDAENTGDSDLHTADLEQARKVMSPIEILDDEDEKKKHGQARSAANDEKVVDSDQNSGAKCNDPSKKDGDKSPVRSLPGSSPDKQTPFTSAMKPFGTVNPTIPGGVKDKFGRHMDMPPHRAAILIPVVPMHDGNGLPISPGLGPASPRMKGFSPRTFSPHLLTHGARPVPVSGMFGGPLSPGGRYSAPNCHHMHGNMKPGIPCKRDLNCPFHGNNSRGIPPGILDIPGHHGPMPNFGSLGHDHMSAVMSRERRERDKSSCASPLGRDTLGDKQALQTPKVVKPIAHVPGKRTPLMLSHLQQIGKQPPSLRELEALHEEKSQRYGQDLLLSPHQMRKSPDRPSVEQIVPGISPLNDRRPLHQQLTLSDLNRRRETDLLKGKADEGLKAKPSEILSSDLVPSSRGPAKLASPPHSKDLNLLSAGRGHRSPVDKRDPVLSMRRLFEEREREFMKPGPPRLRSLDEADVRQPPERQSREERLLTRRHVSPFSRGPSSKEPAIHPVGKASEGIELVSPRGVDRLGPLGLVERDDGKVGPKSSFGHSGFMNPSIRLLEEKRKEVEEMRPSAGREEQRGRERVSPEMDRRDRLEQATDPKMRSRNLELAQLKEKESRKELADKDNVRRPSSEGERSDDVVLLMPGEANNMLRLPTELSPPPRHKLYPERSFLLPGVAGRIDPRMDPRMFALHKLEMHRRGEAIRASEPSHRELLSRMASSLPTNKGVPPVGKPLFVRPDGSLERRPPESSRLPSEVHVYSPPSSLPSREYGFMMNSRQAMERLTAAAGKPGGLMVDVGQDMPPHIRQDIERERERERQRLSLEQIEANRRLLHAELKDKVNPLVFSKEHHIRMERERMDVLRAREKRISDRERVLFMEQRIAEEQKRRYSELESHAMRHSSLPPFSHGADRDEFERVKRLKLAEPPISSAMALQHSKHLGPSALHSDRKEPHLSSPKSHLTSSQFREKASEVQDARINHTRENELVRKTPGSGVLERDSQWHRNRELAALAHGGREHKRSNMHPGTSLHGLLPPKVGPLTSQREEAKGAKIDEDGVNCCSVCKRDASFLCSGCQAAWYCSSECQLSAWSTHNRECSQNKRQQQAKASFQPTVLGFHTLIPCPFIIYL